MSMTLWAKAIFILCFVAFKEPCSLLLVEKEIESSTGISFSKGVFYAKQLCQWCSSISQGNYLGFFFSLFFQAHNNLVSELEGNNFTVVASQSN